MGSRIALPVSGFNSLDFHNFGLDKTKGRRYNTPASNPILFFDR
jgi:hypothetical protein